VALLETHRSRRSYLWLTLVVILAAVVATRAYAAPSEYEVKAVFLFNFAQFVDWPAESFPSPDAPFIIGVVGADPFGPQLDDVVRGERAGGRRIVIERYRNVGEIRNCNILFISGAETGHLEETLAALKGRGILTVSDADPAGPHGVMIRLVNESNRIRLRIDVAAAKAVNLTISSKLLRPAQIVSPGEG
jgi:hypothetical protein